ncbi:efflux transporter outer membrane subunit [Parvibaculum sedimenti]|uniref:Efflux transporter outer membrane subunit n=1 Tax=Parvibaculum sedimenti TaxID=2608632 RepID=A0A6N6VI50_9HYPH|nr:efflux transporter outer membrane subunit [Parvibaculum sedimenti]KAB7738531.1 efflux transporter outer membrane subunit [Parvibaculum sedimenti]
MLIARRPLATFTALLMLSSALAACSMVPDYERPAVAVPASFTSPVAKTGAVDVTSTWWSSFNDPELQSLMDEALKENLDIIAALHRVEQAQGQLRSTNSSLFPTVDASGSASRTTSSDKSGSTRSASGALNVSYALDLWGLYRAQSEASEASLRSSIYAREAAVLVVQSSVATTYFGILNLKDRLAIARESLDAARETLKLVESRFQFGTASALDVSQQRTTLAGIEATIPTLEAELAANQHALAILLGKAPEGFDVKTASGTTATLPAVAVGQPSALLERRPDIREAEANLQSANADIGAARAAFFPTIDLSASKSVDWIANLGTTNGTSIAASILAPIFSGGQLEGNLQTAKARDAELAATYRKTVLTAFGEVEDALTNSDAYSRRQSSLAIAAVEARRSYDLSQASYKAGASDFLSVLDAQRAWLTARDSEAQARLNQYTAAVNLFVALGGGWKS